MEQEFKPEVTAVQVQVNRSVNGLVIYTRVNPKIEEYFKTISMGQEETADLRLTGRNWMLKDGAYMLKLYAISHEPPLTGVVPIKQGSVVGYRLDAPGRRICEPDKNGSGQFINISFMRAIGIADKGIELTIRGVYSKHQVTDIRDGILTAINAFCDQFLSPINYTINLVED